MVKLNLIVEGGVYTNNVSAETANNVEALRQSLHKFFSNILKRDDIEITIFMGTGYRNAGNPPLLWDFLLILICRLKQNIYGSIS